MRKSKSIDISTTRPKPLRTLITAPVRKLQQDKYAKTTGGLPLTSTTGSVPSALATVVDPDAPPATDDLPVGATVYQRMPLTGGVYCPVFSVNFYRQVWFDGLEAFQPSNYTVNSDDCIVPVSSLTSSVIVTASYVKN